MNPISKLFTSTLPIVGVVLLSISVCHFFNYAPCLRVSKSKTGDVFEQIPTAFYPSNPTKISGPNKNFMAYANPSHGCDSSKPPPVQYHTIETKTKDIHLPIWTLVADDSECSVWIKIRNAKMLSYSAIIIHQQNGSSDLDDWVKGFENNFDQVPPALDIFFIGLDDGLRLRDKYVHPKRFVMKYTEEWNLRVLFLRNAEDLGLKFWNTFSKISSMFSKHMRVALRCILKYVLLFIILLLMMSPFILIVIAGYRNRDRYDYEYEPEPEDYFWTDYESSKPRPEYQRREREQRRRAEDERRQANERCGGSKSLQTYRAILGVPENATKEEIVKAFKEKIRRTHPDKNQNESPEITEKMHAQSCLLIEARRCLLERF